MVQAVSNSKGYQRMLVATDFSPSSEAAVKQALWLARQSDATITLAHTLPDLRRAVHSVSYQAKVDLPYGEDSAFQHEVRRESNAQNAPDD